MRFDYPKYQVIFALQDERDEAIPVVRMIMERYPDVDSRMIISAYLPSWLLLGQGKRESSKEEEEGQRSGVSN